MKGKANKANSVNEGNFLDTSKCYCSFSPSLVSRDEIELSFKLKKNVAINLFQSSDYISLFEKLIVAHCSKTKVHLKNLEYYGKVHFYPII